MGLFSKSGATFNWVQLESIAQLHNLVDASAKQPVLFFKHSTRCSISSFALRNFETDWNTELAVTCVFLDLLSHRDLSDALAQKLDVPHQSPQVIVVHNRKVIHHSSHQSIDAELIMELLKSV